MHKTSIWFLYQGWFLFCRWAINVYFKNIGLLIHLSYSIFLCKELSSVYYYIWWYFLYLLVYNNPSFSLLSTLTLCSCHQSHSQPVVSAASPVSRCAADGASGAGLGAVPRGQHGLCPHPGAVYGETAGVGEGERRGWTFSSCTKIKSFLLKNKGWSLKLQ